MDFYILKKQDKLVAIPADEQNCKQYLEDGYFYIDKVAACNEQSALEVLQNKQTKVFKTPVLLFLLALPVIAFIWWQITR
jgi:hypothetical protein